MVNLHRQSEAEEGPLNGTIATQAYEPKAQFSVHKGSRPQPIGLNIFSSE